MFSCSIAENIAYGADDPASVTAAQVERVADVANAAAFIRSFPQGFGTVVGEKGVLLSGAWRLPPGGPRSSWPRGLSAASARPRCSGVAAPRPLKPLHPSLPPPASQRLSRRAVLGVALFPHLRKGVFCHLRPLKTAPTAAGAGAPGALGQHRSRSEPGWAVGEALPPGAAASASRPREVCHVASSSLDFLTACKT